MKKVITVLSVFIIVVLLFVGCKEDETVAKFINTEVEGTYTLSELEQMSEEERKSNLENKHIRVRGLVTDAESYKLELDTDKIEVNAYFADENNKDENEDLDECEVVIDGVCTNTYGKYVRIYGVSVIEKNFDEKEKKKQIVRDIEAKNKVEREEYRIREAIEDAFGKKKIENIDVINAIADNLSKRNCKFYTCHCTGIEPFKLLKNSIGEKIESLSTGQVLSL